MTNSCCLLSSALTQDYLIIVLFVVQWWWKPCHFVIKSSWAIWKSLLLTLLVDWVATDVALSPQVKGTHVELFALNVMFSLSEFSSYLVTVCLGQKLGKLHFCLYCHIISNIQGIFNLRKFVQWRNYFPLSLSSSLLLFIFLHLLCSHMWLRSVICHAQNPCGGQTITSSVGPVLLSRDTYIIVSARIANLWDYGDSSVPSYHLAIGAVGLQEHPFTSSLFVGAENSNSSLYA